MSFKAATPDVIKAKCSRETKMVRIWERKGDQALKRNLFTVLCSVEKAENTEYAELA